MKKLLLALLLATSPAMAGNVPAKQGGLQTNSPTAHGTITNSVISGNVAASSSSPSACFSIAAGTYGQVVNNICSGWTTAVSASGVANLVNANNQL